MNQATTALPPAAGFRLVHYFAVTGLVAFLLVAAALLYFGHQQGEFFKQMQQAQLLFFKQTQSDLAGRQDAAAASSLLTVHEGGNVNLTRLFSNSLWVKDFAPFVAKVQRIPIDHCRAIADVKDAGGKSVQPGEKKACYAGIGKQIMALPEFQALNAKVYDTMKKSTVFKIKVFDLRGITAYSSEHGQIGEDKIGNAGWESAVAGKPASELTHRNKFSAFEGVVENRDLISSYLPVLAPGGEKIVGVFEVYSDVTPFLAQIKNTSSRMTMLSDENQAKVEQAALANQDKVGASANRLLAAIFVLLVLLYLALFLIVRHGQHIIDKQDFERKQAESVLSHLNRVLAVLSGVNSAIVRIRNRQELFEEACRIAVEHGKFGLAWIGLFDPATLDVTPVASAGLGSDEMRQSKATVRADVPQGQGVLGRAIRESRPVFDNDISVEKGVGGKRRQEALRLGYRSLIVLPLFAEDAVAGILALFAREPGFFTEEEIKLLTELAGNISFALESIARQEKIERLSRIRSVLGEMNAAIVRIRSKQHLFEEACRIAHEHGKFTMAWIGVLDETTQQISPVAKAGRDEGYLEALKLTIDPNTTRNLAIAVEAIGRGAPVVCNDIATDGRMRPWRAAASQRGYRSMGMLPLLLEQRAVGVFALYSSETGLFDEDEMKLLVELAGDIAFALQSISHQEKLEYLSYYDALTGLPNRRLFVDRLSQQMRSRSDEPRMVALVLLDIERLRNINATLGRHGGDELLRLVARRLEHAFNGPDYIARIGADGFGVVIRGVRDATEIAHAIEGQVLACFKEPFLVNDKELRVAAKIGIAMFPTDGGDADTLFKNAEAALRKAKDTGERFLFYRAEMNAQAAQSLSLETRLRKAVEAQQFVLHYQPKVELASGRVCGLEALIRWQDPESGMVAPGAFIPLLEETGLILEVGRWALAQALAQHREWTARGGTVPRIAVNVSAIQLQQKDYADSVIETVRRGGNVPEAIELEITESLLMKDIEASIRKLSILRGLGIHIAMDDFGTGYSSLSYITRLPINSVKIDRSFINEMANSPQDMAIVTTIIALARSLNLRVVAEGVETEDQAQLLRLLKCDEMQGYLFSRPLPAAEVEAKYLAAAVA